MNKLFLIITILDQEFNENKINEITNYIKNNNLNINLYKIIELLYLNSNQKKFDYCIYQSVNTQNDEEKVLFNNLNDYYSKIIKQNDGGGIQR